VVTCDHPDCNFEGQEDKRWFTINNDGATVLTEADEKLVHQFCSLSCADLGRKVWSKRYG
jgi:hypothetical protein